MAMAQQTQESGATGKHPYLPRKFQVGSANSDKFNYPLAERFFHNKDVKPEVLEAKKTVQKMKSANVLGTEAPGWNTSTIADQKIQKDTNKDIKRQLLKVRAGLMDERTSKPSKHHTEEAIAERHKFIVQCTGQGPIGKLTGKWMNSVDERGLAKHHIREDWPDWNESHQTATKDDDKHRAGVFQQQEERRKKMLARDNKLNASGYVKPHQAVANVNECLRERKIDFQDLKEQFKRELKVEFPLASEERLQAMAQRLLNEKLLADEKVARFPVQHESFRPNLSLTTQDRRYKEYNHPGKFDWMESEKRHGWSCCLNFDQDSRGCEHKILNPDAWCLKGYERC